MHFLLVVVLSLAVTASALVKVDSLVGFHERVGIPAATRIKETEDAIFATQAQNRIVGGSIAPANAHPYMGGLIINFEDSLGTSACGSSLISESRLVTAAHCWFDGSLQANRFLVVLGSRYLFYGGQRIATSAVAAHPWWSPSTLQNDVAVIHLPLSISFTESIQPIALPHDNLRDTFTGEWSVAAGYGKTNDQQVGVSMTTMISYVNLRVISVAQCWTVFGLWIQASNICVSGAGGVGICGGDSGGPLVVTRNGQQILVGISSFGAEAGCELGFPSAFTRVTSFYDFIISNM